MAWAHPYVEPTFPDKNQEVFRLRAGRVFLEAKPTDDITATVQMALEIKAILHDYKLTWSKFDYANVTVGQFKLPLGASVLQPLPELVMLERPDFIIKMTKAGFRDLGVMLHTGKGTMVEYSLGAFNGTGRVNFGQPLNDVSALDALLTGRVAMNFAPLFAGKQDRLTLGFTGARSSDRAVPGQDDPKYDKSQLGNFLGTSVALTKKDRTTYLGGADLNFSMYGVWVLAEVMVLDSIANDGSEEKKSRGAYLEAAYTIPGINTQLAGRVENFDPNLDAEKNEAMTYTAGLNQKINKHLSVGAFGTRAEYVEPKTATTPAAAKVGHRVEARVVLKF